MMDPSIKENSSTFFSFKFGMIQDLFQSSRLLIKSSDTSQNTLLSELPEFKINSLSHHQHNELCNLSRKLPKSFAIKMHDFKSLHETNLILYKLVEYIHSSPNKYHSLIIYKIIFKK